MLVDVCGALELRHPQPQEEEELELIVQGNICQELLSDLLKETAAKTKYWTCQKSDVQCTIIRLLSFLVSSF